MSRGEVRVEDRIRSWLAEELEAGGEPPIGDLVREAERRGDRTRVRRRLQAGVGGLVVVVALLVGGFVAFPGGPADDRPSVLVASGGARGATRAAPPARTVAQRLANETKDGDPRSAVRWGPAQWESFQAAARGVFDQLGRVNPVAAQREGTTDTYLITVSARDGREYLVRVDYLTMTVLPVQPVG